MCNCIAMPSFQANHQSFTISFFICILVGCTFAANAIDHPAKDDGMNVRTNRTTIDKSNNQVYYIENTANRSNSDHSPDNDLYQNAVLTPYERQMFAYGFTKVQGHRCREDLYNVFRGILNGHRWAIAIYDATAKSASGIESGVLHQFGHFDECMDQERFQSNAYAHDSSEIAIVPSKYCLVDIQMNGFAMHTVASRQKEALNRNGDAVVAALWGACVPATCDSADIAIFLQSYLQRNVLNASESACQLSNFGADNRLHIDAGMFAYALVIFVFILLAILSTAYHCYLIYPSKQADDITKRALRQEPLTIALLSFSVVENTKKLFQASKDHMGLNSINGIKAIAMLLILAGHALSFIYGSPIFNVAFVAEQTKSPTFAFLYNSLLFVDTFMLLSGFLFCRILLIELERRCGHLNPLVLYIGRYIRLTPAYMAIIGFYMTWFPSIGSGPLWRERIVREQERCQASWWLNVLYVNNYFNTDKFCMFQSWYLSVDTQLFFIAPIFIYSLHKTRKYGQRMLIVAVFCTASVPFLVTFVRQLDPTLLVYADKLFQTLVNPIFDGLKLTSVPTLAQFYLRTKFIELIDLASNKYYIGYYIKTHMRASAYFIGLLTGYLVHIMQEKGTKLPKILVRLSWLLSTVIGMASMFSICRFYKSPYTNIDSFLYAGFHKIGWNLSVAWLVLAATTDHAGWLQKVLSSRFFAPISRLTYCAYLSNGLVELYHSSTLRYASYQSYVNLENDIFSHIVDTFILAFVLCLLFESPIHALERILLRNAGRHDKRAKNPGVGQSPSTSEEQVA